MRIERHFPMLEAPAGGLAMLRTRLDRTTRRRTWPRPAAALAVVLAALVAIPWLLDIAHTRHGESLQLEELRRTLAAHRRPDLEIDGKRPGAVALESDRLEVYFIEEGG